MDKIDGSNHHLPDVTAFIRTIKESSDFFDAGGADIFVARAPGRLDVMGGIADYSGSLVLEMPVAEAALVALQKQSSRGLKIYSRRAAEGKPGTNLFEMSLDDFEKDGEIIGYEEACAGFKKNAATGWAAYMAGVFLVLMREWGIKFSHGARVLIDSKVPEGKGVSSSAAIEVAVMSAVAAAFDICLTPRETAILCQKIENLVVGAPCGIMDQMTSACGAAHQLMKMICQPAELLGVQKIPDEIAVWGLDSGIRHSVGAGDYGSVRTGAFMGYRMMADLAGLEVKDTVQPGVVAIDDPHWRGYLANIAPSDFAEKFADFLPVEISGEKFLTRYQGITDTVTRVDSRRTYAVLKPTAHPVYENWRVHRFAELLNETMTENNLEALGELMYESHKSYSACGLGTDGTDLLVELVRQSKNLYGAKITGGGSGGTVAVLGRREAGREIVRIAADYHQRTGYQPYIFSGSSVGAAEFGVLKLEQS